MDVRIHESAFPPETRPELLGVFLEDFLGGSHGRNAEEGARL
jgi:hypothetical protein